MVALCFELWFNSHLSPPTTPRRKGEKEMQMAMLDAKQPPKDAFPPLHDRTLERMRARLHRWELLHLREHCTQLAAQLEEANERAAHAEANADYWREQVMQIQEDLDSDLRLGMTRDGQLGIVQAGDAPV